MDRRLELVEALLTLGKQAERVAKLLSADVVGEMRDDTLLTTLPITNKSLDLSQFLVWPEASFYRADPNYRAQMVAAALPSLADMSVLEFSAGLSYPIAHFHKHAKVDLITDGFKFPTQPANTKIINSFAEAKEMYDMGIIWESLEAREDPPLILTEFKKRCRKVTIRFRPWTARDGGFQSYHFNKAYAHLVMDLENPVKFKVVRPLATYESLLAKCGLSVLQRQVNSTTPEEYLLNKEFLEVVVARTWDKIRFDEAIRIMITDSVDYVVGT